MREGEKKWSIYRYNSTFSIIKYVKSNNLHHRKSPAVLEVLAEELKKTERNAAAEKPLKLVASATGATGDGDLALFTVE